ncbi:xanthine dehydrogenase accessory factor [Tistlia consotensis]|uniref:Xanthine dehydrogenase accessory factor n=1 Tax=Tistlia consotensis USBA 355 TaxID=560819 RepID=A0A1Y6CIA2_9PROT|nr:XdhC family protein [Tistlia consotensis]SMF64447.1 xanthine dehydrogenase accessory factor [Tistlia consotensis USBA 355]SNR97485.1 xanthine dehydrogenase accessory factor [Tistlia consotensis]
MTSAEKILDLIERLRAEGADFCVATVVRTANATSAKAGAKAVVTADGLLHGFVGGGCVTGAVRKAGLEALRRNEPTMIRVRPKEEVAQAGRGAGNGPQDADGVPLHASMCPSGGTVELFLEPLGQAPRLVVCGASPVAQALVAQAAAVGRRVIAAAPAEEQERLAGADVLLDGYDLAGLRLGPRDAVVVATQGRRDREALKAALESGAGYLGMVGSRRKVQTLAGRLREELSPEASARLPELHGPAGLDIGAIEPEEIALSILAELVQLRRKADRGVPVASAG